jgi:hypothetical protein
MKSANQPSVAVAVQRTKCAPFEGQRGGESPDHYQSAASCLLTVGGSVYDFAGILLTRAEMAECPVYIVHDEGKIGFPDGAVRFITHMSIRESEHFRRRFEPLDRKAAPSLRPINFCCDVHNVFGRRGGLILPG